jgi:regulator of nucleoside diphosphate kinase
MQRARLVNTLDRQRVRDALAVSGTPPSHAGHDRSTAATATRPLHHQRLLDRLEHARPVRPVCVPPDLVTMNSIVRVIDLDTNESDTYALRYEVNRPSEPHEATAITVHDLLGSELLSRWVGEQFEFEGRRGPVRLRVAAMDFQPERSGCLHL